jgi:acyl-coenzyme A synthetase/AMP-(fatty) acid ligase
MRRPDLSSTARYIAWYASHAPDATAIVDNGAHITYRDLATDLVRCVRALAAFGVRPSMLVGLQMLDRYPNVLLLLACEVTGATAMSLSEADLSSGDPIIRHCDVVLAAGVAVAADPARTIAIPTDFLAGLAASPVSEDHLSMLDRTIAPDQIVRIVRTSGTTGRPKAMPMSHATQQLRVIRNVERAAADILPNPRFLCLYGPRVGSIYVRLLGVLQHGGTVLFTVGEHAATLIAIGAVNYASFAVGDIERLLPRAMPPPAGHKLHLVVFGAAVTPRLRRWIGETLHARVANGYASNETTTIAVVDDDNVGTLCPGVAVRIVDPAGREVPRGEAGVIRVRSETMVHGYFNDPAMTAAAFIDGWFHTGDIGRMPEPGKLVVLGRADSMLNIGGVKVAPAPIEARMKSVEGVSDVVVMSVTGPYDGGVLLAAVEIGDAPPPLDAMQRIGAILSRYSGRFVIMPMRRFPRTDSGKIRRPEIEAAFHQSAERDLIGVG